MLRISRVIVGAGLVTGGVVAAAPGQQVSVGGEPRLAGPTAAVIPPPTLPPRGPNPAGRAVGQWVIRSTLPRDLPAVRRSAVVSLAYAADGKALAAAHGDGDVELWDVASGRVRITLKAEAPCDEREPRGGEEVEPGQVRVTRRLLWEAIRSAAYAPDGQTVAVAGSIQEEVTREERHVLEETPNSTAVTGSTSVSQEQAGRVTLWDAASGRKRRTLQKQGGEVISVTFAPDGGTLATGGEDGTVRLWDVAEGQGRATLWGHTAAVMSLAYAPDGKTLASASRDGAVRLWDVATRHERATLWPGREDDSPVTCVAYAPDGRSVASGGEDGGIRMWDPATGRPRALLGTRGEGIPAISALAFAPDGGTIASADRDGEVRLWDVATGQATAVLQIHTFAVLAVSFSPDGRTLATGDSVGFVKLWGQQAGPGGEE